MTEPFGYCSNIDAVGDQQSSVGMTQGMDIGIGQVIFSNELPDPGCQAIWMQRITVPLGEYEIIIVPAIAELKPLHRLLFSVLFQFSKNNIRQFDDTVRPFCFWSVYVDTFLGRVENGSLDVKDFVIEIYILPLKPTDFTAAHSGIYQQSNEGFVLQTLFFQTVKEAEHFLIVHAADFFLLHTGSLYPVAWVAGNDLPHNCSLEDGRQEPVMV